MKKMLMIGIWALGLSGIAGAETMPFGFQKGTSEQDILKMGASVEGTGLYLVSKAPKPNSAFDSYLLIATKTQGLCKVVAYTADILNDSDGFKTKRIFSDLGTSLTSLYGEGTKYDYNKSSSIWKNSDDWMMALKVEDRTLVTYWTETNKLPTPLVAMSLEAAGLSSSKGFVKLSYEFDNFSNCQKEIKGNPTDGL